MRNSSLSIPNFSSETMIDVMLFFLLHPDEEAYLGRIVRATNKALIQVQRSIRRLLESGLIRKIQREKRTVYKAASDHFAFEDLKNLVLKAKIWSPSFKQERKALESLVDFGFIYGSIAKGSYTSQSDLDIFLIGNLSLHDTSKFMSQLGRKLLREVNIIIYTPEELNCALKNENSFVVSVISNPKIWIFGNRHEFEKLYR